MKNSFEKIPPVEGGAEKVQIDQEIASEVTDLRNAEGEIDDVTQELQGELQGAEGKLDKPLVIRAVDAAALKFEQLKKKYPFMTLMGGVSAFVEVVGRVDTFEDALIKIPAMMAVGAIIDALNRKWFKRMGIE